MKNSNQYIDLISKYLLKQTNPDEERVLVDWINRDKQNQKQFEEFKKVWEISETHFDPEIHEISLDEEWSKIEMEISGPKINHLEKQINKSQFNWLKIAASISIIILIGSGLYFLFSPNQTVISTNNNVKENKLPDGSLITLNQFSKISYTDNFNKKFREVELNGEAYFKVLPDKSKPFIVKAGLLHVEVVGTSFYIKNLPNSINIDVIVESGTVKLYNESGNQKSVILKSGESVSFDSQTLKISEPDNPDINSTSWKTKVFNFENATLENIVHTLNKNYQTNIIIMNPALKNCSLTVSLSNQSIESILKVLEATLDIRAEIKGNAIEISGDECGNKTNE